MTNRDEAPDSAEPAPQEAAADDAVARPEIGAGLAFLHGAVGTALLQTVEAQAHLYALTELLIARGIIPLKDFERRKAAAMKSATEEAMESWQGAQVLPDEADKYEVEPVDIDCLARMPLCHAACCRLEFNLSRQDVAEGVVQWDFARPYKIRHREDGWCAHCDPATKSCGVRDHRPLVCRSYDCRQDARIWTDFERRVPNPELAKLAGK